MKAIIYIIIFTLYSINIHAQSGTLKGKVTDASNNDPVPFANVVIYNTEIASVTDLDGNFTFTGLEPGYVKLYVSYIGYKRENK